jgi:hypothetical protein
MTELIMNIVTGRRIAVAGMLILDLNSPNQNHQIAIIAISCLNTEPPRHRVLFFKEKEKEFSVLSVSPC